MTSFRVWAPIPRRVELLLGGEQIEMRRSPEGWWVADVPAAGPGTDYAFLLDGAGPFPDPRSPWQPRGVDGPSRTVDHGAFAWSDQQWRAGPLAAAVLYELHVGTFTRDGTFDSAIERLDHLAELGVTHVELMPVNEFGGDRGWGYDGVLLYAPHHAYGGPEGLRRLVDACHAHGLAVVLDVVYNHLGPTGNHLPRFGPYVTERHRTPWGGAINLDGPGSDEVRRFVVDNALAWLRDYHLDALRIDAVHAIVDTSAVHLLEQLATEVDALESHLGRPLALIAESDLNDPRLVRSREAGGYGLDAQWNDDAHHALHVALTAERDRYYADFSGLADFSRALVDNYAYAGRFSVFRGRRHGRPATDQPASRFVAFLQNHDQVGNRASGERLSMLVDDDLLAAGAALLLLSPFVPLLFMGEEWAADTPFLYFTDHPTGLGEAIRAGRQAEFAGPAAGAAGDPRGRVPDPQDRATFEASKLDWSEPGGPRGSRMLSWYRALLGLRRSRPNLAAGRHAGLAVEHDESGTWIVVRRGDVVVASNLGHEACPVTVAGAAAGAVLLAWGEPPRVGADGGTVELEPRSTVVMAVPARQGPCERGIEPRPASRPGPR